MRKILILLGMLALTPQFKTQLLLEALEGEVPFTPSEKCLERVKDKYYGDGDHNFIYCAVMGPNGKKWLNLNLGAEYAREGSPHFNPEAQPTDYNDWKAYGSLFQWGRGADGHELGKYIDDPNNVYWIYEFKNPLINSQIDNNTLSKNTVVNSSGWTSGLNITSVNNNWATQNTKNPCPNGYRVMSSTDVKHITHNIDIPENNTYGYATSSRLIPNLNGVYVNLLLAPNVEPPISGRSITPSRKLDVESARSGTSMLWVLPESGNDLLRYGHTWERPHLYNNNPRIITMLDNGVFRNEPEDELIWGLASLGLVYLQPLQINSAIRCVEQ